jgi:hypothetical protein
MTLNDPVGYQPTADDDEWTPGKGLRRGAATGATAALAVGFLLGLLAFWRPLVLIPMALRLPMTLALTWLLMRVVQRAAGRVGRQCTIVAVSLVMVILLSHHVVFAVAGVPKAIFTLESWWLFPVVLVEPIFAVQSGRMAGWRWFHPYVLLALDAVPLVIGSGLAALMFERD